GPSVSPSVRSSSSTSGAVRRCRSLSTVSKIVLVASINATISGFGIRCGYEPKRRRAPTLHGVGARGGRSDHITRAGRFTPARCPPVPFRGVGPLLQPVGQGVDQFAVGGVTAELPEERPAEPLVLDVGHLPRQGGRGVVAPPVVAAVGVGGARDGSGGRAGVLEHLVVLDA